MRYTLEMLREDISRLRGVTSGLRHYTPEALWPQISLDDAGDRLALNPNTPEAAAYDYFRQRYGSTDGPDFAARFFAIHYFVLSNVEKLARRGFLQSTKDGHTPAEDLLTFLLTCFEDPAPGEPLPHSIYDPSGGMALPFQDILADFHRLRALRARFANQGSGT
jgi:hypothetical protein